MGAGLRLDSASLTFIGVGRLGGGAQPGRQQVARSTAAPPSSAISAALRPIQPGGSNQPTAWTTHRPLAGVDPGQANRRESQRHHVLVAC